MTLIEGFMLARIIIDLLTVAPHVAEDVTDALEALKSEKNSSDKAAAVIQGLEDILSQAKTVLADIL